MASAVVTQRPDRAAHDAAAAFACGVALVVVAGFAVSRIGWADPLPLAPLGALGLAWTLTLAPAALWTRTSAKSAAWYAAPAALSLASLVGLGLAGRAVPYAMPAASVVVATTGAVLLVRHLARMRRDADGLRVYWPLLPLATVVGLWVVGHAWGSGYQSPLLLEKLATGRAHIDPLYHLAVAQMIDVHGAVSTGLDGTPHTAYHFGSHLLFGGLARAAGLDLPTWYALGFVAVVVPWVLQLLLGLSLDVWRQAGFDPLPLASGRSWGAWLLWLTALAGVFIPDFSHRAWVGANLTISESYAVGTGLSLAIGRLALHVWQGWRAGAPVGVVSWLAIAMPLATVATALTKVSHCALLLGLAGWFWLRMGLWRRAGTWLSLGLCAALAAAVAVYTTPKGLSQGMLPFAFVWQDVMRQVWTAQSVLSLVAFLLLHPLWLWVFLAMRLGLMPDWRGGGWRAALREGTVLDVELLVVFAALAFLPGLVLPVQGGGAYYFSDVQRWLGIALVVGAWPRMAQATAGRWSRGPVHLAGVVAACLLVASFGYHTYRGLLGWQNELAETREQWLAAGSTLGKATVAALQTLRKVPPEQLRKSALFVPREERAYWELLPDKAVPFVGPALSGLPHVGGLPMGDYTRHSYGYAAYGTARPKVNTVAQALRRAAELGYERVFVVQAGRVRVVAVTPGG